MATCSARLGRTRKRPPEGTLFSASTLDSYSRIIVGCVKSASKDRRLARTALEMDVSRWEPAKGFIHYIDRGSPYASEDYQVVLDGHELVSSMSRRGNCLDNAAIASRHSSLKNELGETSESMADAIRRLLDHIEVLYINQRRQSTRGRIGAREFERRYAARMAALPAAPADSGSPYGRPSIDGPQGSPNREVIDAMTVAVSTREHVPEPSTRSDQAHLLQHDR